MEEGGRSRWKTPHLPSRGEPPGAQGLVCLSLAKRKALQRLEVSSQHGFVFFVVCAFLDLGGGAVERGISGTDP